MNDALAEQGAVLFHEKDLRAPHWGGRDRNIG